MEINCQGCGKCCYSKNLTDFISDKVAYDHEDPNRPEERDNIVILNKPEVKLFWDRFLLPAMVIKQIGISPDEKEIVPFIALGNFPKKIDAEWVSACPFLDPKTKMCRIHGTKFFPQACKKYPFDFINDKIRPLCDKDRLIGPLTEDQKKIKLETRYIKIKSEGHEELIKKIKEGSNPEALKEILTSYFGTPTGPTEEERRFFQGIFDEINKELKFYRENFHPNVH